MCLGVVLLLGLILWFNCVVNSSGSHSKFAASGLSVIQSNVEYGHWPSLDIWPERSTCMVKKCYKRNSYLECIRALGLH